MMKRKNGNTKSQGVMPFHAECLRGAKVSPCPALTRIMPATVIPRRTSSEMRRDCLDIDGNLLKFKFKNYNIIRLKERGERQLIIPILL
jgi:hypothetical protein